MTFEELRGKLVTMPLQEVRVNDARYVEVVAAGDGIGPVKELIEQYFGAPLKPEGREPSKDEKKCADPYGGIRKNQTMYFLPGEDGASAVLVWPWSDGYSVTYKLFRS